jgi:hypothetical protein
MTNPDNPPVWSDPTASASPAPPPVHPPEQPTNAWSSGGAQFPAPVQFPSPPDYSSPPPAPEFSVGTAPVARPAFPAPDPGFAPTPGYPPVPYGAAGYPVTAPPASGFGGYGGYGVQPGYGPPPGYPMYAPPPKTNGMAVASMVVSIVGITMLACYGAGGVLGIVGAILGHVSRRQIRERQESGDGMALAGIITGWIATGLGLIVLALIVIFVVWAVNTPYDPALDGTTG